MKCPIKKYEPGDFELDKHYCDIAKQRISEERNKPEQITLFDISELER